LAILIGLPLAEILVIILVGQAIGAGPTVALLLLDVIAGALVVRHGGAAAWRRLRIAAEEGELPVAEAFDGICVLLAGILLAVPGFISDAVALLLLFPPLRSGLRGLLSLLVAGRVETAVFTRTRTIEGEYHEVHGTLPPETRDDGDRS